MKEITELEIQRQIEFKQIVKTFLNELELFKEKHNLNEGHFLFKLNKEKTTQEVC